MPKPYILSAFLLLFTTITGFAQDKVMEPTEKLRAIEQTVRRIDSLGPYTTKTLDNSFFLLQGDSLNKDIQRLMGYYNKKTLVKMMYSRGIPRGMITEVYYYEAGELLFVRVKKELYPKPKKNTTGQNFFTSETTHKASYFFDEKELLEIRNFGNGPLEGMFREEKRDFMLKRAGELKALLINN